MSYAKSKDRLLGMFPFLKFETAHDVKQEFPPFRTSDGEFGQIIAGGQRARNRDRTAPNSLQ